MKTMIFKRTVVILAVCIANTTFGQNWSLTGNAGTDPATNFIGTTDNKTFKIKTNNQTRINVISSGKVGIGNFTPVWRFDVKGGSINTDSLYRINGVAALSQSGSDFQVGSGTSRIGIGTSSPLASLHVNTASQEAIRVNGGTNLIGGTGMFMSFYENSVYRGYIGSYSGSGADMDFGTGGSNTTGSVHLTIAATPRFTLNSSGNVGIGTTTPVSRLSVLQTGTTNPTFELTNTSKGPNISYGHFGATGDWYLRSAANAGKVILQDQSASGTVAIGTTYVPAGYKLAVSGKVICSELKVQLPAAWPDYVFGEDYSLMSLTDLRNYVNANHHLPGIPSAEVVESNGGVEVGEMQRLLIEKVEELTLYILQQEEKIRNLQTAVEQLKK